MAIDYRCTKCKKSLYNAADQKLVLTGVLKGKHFSAESMFELNHQQDAFGGVPLAANLMVEKGAQVNFFCPHCGHDLTMPFDEEVSEVTHVDEQGAEHAFLFSKVAGKEMSFLVHKEKKEVLGAYGKDHEDYLYRLNDFFNMWNRF
ncbi:MAG TPA: hypothetical protein PLV42_11735 [bacterium]|nr:hypothetical protein [bacterium]